ncbi:hypothetical protein H0G86_000887 [Trichoderma simmonsii]|uniref:Uncharacterized protein n=1 Tax=Trichoderma simmonsii TaxID=1491479 RepID=A0A8G0PEE6_9HYPO|nr:hypothetical protein H0G86_000887 [Trichoderma simmonsii]
MHSYLHRRLDPSSHYEYKRAWSSLGSATRVTNPALHAQIHTIHTSYGTRGSSRERLSVQHASAKHNYFSSASDANAKQKTITHALHLQRYTKSPHFKVLRCYRAYGANLTFSLGLWLNGQTTHHNDAGPTLLG